VVGIAAGILGLTSWIGFAFFFAAVVGVLSAVLLARGASNALPLYTLLSEGVGHSLLVRNAP